ncbi:inorganic diphosphatase [Flavilitoribacter nigricans]|uniref:inorganic diphosphatase n=1 Tax=Flavilitoribacter nigricans (strain ATCC 23147 / DSM 23189 / NBRC 102662 / NCIMB 1420 / SS-2) TaxID=1122177 RepID=A0A2D0N2M7_FLAN2|nr:inorganic diphosphatase [Flavilitoribacter nigricans]PHN02648.1 inorganic pyrophosphatase [Flavilitoribacter nigricans DSM 23189 = NBRC 102662]
MKNLIPVLLFTLGCVLSACDAVGTQEKVHQLPALTGEGFQVVVEIPAGTNKKLEFQKDDKEFRAELIDGKERMIHFLPYPGNYGFIPSTLMEASRGGDGDPLDVLLVCESLPTGSVVEALPIGTLKLSDRGEIDTKIIAVPLDSSLRVFPAANFQDLLLEYDPARRIIEEWFLYYKGYGVTELIGWEDEQYAWREIQKWQVD